MSTHRPPALLDRALRLVLRPRDRDTISGDLLEIYADEKLPQLGPLRANLWYARQLLSILPHRAVSLFGGKLMKTIWIAASIFLVLACSWFVTMELILRHPYFEIRATVCALVVLYAALCLAYTRSRATALRRPLTLSAIATFGLGVYALIFEFRTIDFEGYIFLIALGLITQGALTVFHMRQRPSLRPA